MADPHNTVSDQEAMNRWPSDVGILDMELYFPSYYVDQTALETFDGASAGKYTIGLGQKEMGFCTDREDVASLCLTVVSRLFDRQSPDLRRQIGRLEVGTETLIDKSKSVKSVLMQLFEPYDQTDIEGVDTLNACFGGTQALFNALNWIESSSWDGRFALVVMGDIAVYGAGGARCTGGAGAIAMLIGPNASIVFDRGVRSIHMRHSYDFYKPNMSCEYPTVDGPMSVEGYLSSIDRCYTLYREKVAKIEGRANALTLDEFDACLFHSPFSKLVQKSVARLRYLDVMKNPERFSAAGESVLKFKDTPPEKTYSDKELEKTFMEFSRDVFGQKTEPSLWLAKHVGNMYTPSLYSGLISYLLNTPRERLKDGGKLLFFSYGSGSASAMFSARIRHSAASKPTGDQSDPYSLESLIRNLQGVRHRLERRHRVTPEEFTAILKTREAAYGKAPYTPKGKIEDLFPGTYYLTEIDEKYRRKYQVAQFSWPERNGPVSG